MKNYRTTRVFIQALRMSTDSAHKPGPIESQIISKLKTEFEPTYLKIYNDSHKHSGHHGLRGATNTTESHFRIEIASDKFQNKSQPIRHRMIYSLLKDELENKGVHALQMKTKTTQEFDKNAFKS